MDHASTPPHREEDCCDDECRWHGDPARADTAASFAPIALKSQHGNLPFTGVDLIVQTARADAATARTGQPFLLQADRTLYIVASEPNGWVVADLTFDPECCVFTEQSRARFDWPREAFGRLLSRIYLTSAVDDSAFDEIAESFERWLARQFVA